jgi:hypothetical protein
LDCGALTFNPFLDELLPFLFDPSQMRIDPLVFRVILDDDLANPIHIGNNFGVVFADI